MGREEARATPMYVDNSEAVELSKERRSCQRLRRVDRRDLKVREYIAYGGIEVLICGYCTPSILLFVLFIRWGCMRSPTSIARYRPYRLR
eukprot:6182536-Pleurochrysis_carterae.AAC.1